MSGISFPRPTGSVRFLLLAVLALLAGLLAAVGPPVPAAGGADGRDPGADARRAEARSPAPAAAVGTGTIVWAKGGQIWAMNGDGSNQRLLIPLTSTPGMSSMSEPAVHPAGQLVAFNASTQQFKTTHFAMCGAFPYMYPCNTVHFGFNATGAYQWQNGQATRLTGAPSYCFNCTSGEDTPEPRTDGKLVYGFLMCTGFLGEGSYDCVGAVKSTSGEVYPSCDEPADPAPNPAAPGQVAYTGCIDAADNVDALVVTGPDRAGERVIGCDDTQQSDPAWSPDGTHVVVSEGGTEPGLWVYAATNQGCLGGERRHAVVAPADVTLESPRFTGDGRILFAAQGEIWAVPADCSGCTFPGAATRLTTGGDNAAPAWTSATLSAAGPGPGPTDPGPPADTTAPTVTLGTTAPKQKVLKQRALLVSVRSNENAAVRVSGKITLPGKDATVTAKGTAAAGKATTVKVRLSARTLRKVRAAIRHGKVVAKLKVTVTDPAGNATVRAVKVRLVR